MSTTTVSTNSLPSNVPKLDVSGTNFAIFKVRFTRAVKSKGVWGHLDGSTPRPTPAVATGAAPAPVAVAAQPPAAAAAGQQPAPAAAPAATATATPGDSDEEKWDKNEAIALDLLTQRIPDSTVIRTSRLNTAAEMWTEIVREYTEKGAYAQTDLRTRFLEMKCPERGDVHEWLEQLRSRREELAQVGVNIEEKDYRSTIISSLPGHLSGFASNLLASARLFSPSKTIDPDVIISLVNEEYQRRRSGRPSTKPSTTRGRDNGEALAVTSSPSRGTSHRGNSNGGRRNGSSNSHRGSTRGGSRSSQSRGCWTCGSPEHIRRNCPDNNNKKNNSHDAAQAAIESSGDEAFGVSDDDSDSEPMPGLLDVTDSSVSDGDSDAGSHVTNGELDDWEIFPNLGENHDSPWGDGWDTEELSGTESERSSFVSVDPDSVGDEFSPDFPNPEELAADVNDGPIASNSTRTELYDSGTTRHISPYRNMFNNFVNIAPKSLNAANKQRFAAVGQGDLVIEVPNGIDVSKLQLTKVLFSPEVGYTLVSIGKLDKQGYKFLFGDGKMTMHDRDGETIGEVLKTEKGVYKVIHDGDDGSYAATEPITLMEFHRRMGHISPAVAKKLAEKGMATGLRVDTSSGEMVFCESCVYAKATRKPIAKERQGERAKEFGDEIHTDLWGPAPVATLRGRRYFVTFTDDSSRLSDIHLLRRKGETLKAYINYEAEVKTQRKASIKTLHSDRGGEYTGKEFVVHLKKQGTRQKLTVHDTPEHKGVAERLNHTILEKIRAMLHASGQPRFLWGEAAHHAVWLKNCTPTKALDGKTPFEVATGKKPDLSGLREWGCRVWVRNQESAKLGGRVAEGVWVGFDTKSNGSRIYWPAKKKVSIERNCYFDDITRSSDGLEGEEEVVVEAPRVPPLTSISNSETPHFEPPSTHQQPPTPDDDNGSQPQAAT